MARMEADRTRTAVVKTCQKMYDEDPRADEVLHTLAQDMVGKGLTVTTGNPQADEIATALIERLDLVSRLDDWVRLTARDGDSFLEVEVSDAREIVGVTRKPTLEMYRNSNKRDEFNDPRYAFWWSDEPHTWGTPGPNDALWFSEWQIIHARWNHDEGKRYGRPLFRSATGTWKRVNEGENDVATRRKTRAGMKYNHQFPPGTTPQEIKAYKETNADILDSPLAAIQDFFGTAEIKPVEGDAKVSDIEDILHHIRTWWIASPVPMSLLGYGQDLNRDVLEKQKEQYDETLEGLRPWIQKEILRPLFELAWLLAGILPETLTVKYHWKAKRVLKPADLRDIADAALRLRALGFPDPAIWTLIQQFLPDVDIEALLAPQGNESEGTPDVTAGSMDRLLTQIPSAGSSE
ncbi:MAG: hypothetical protein JXR84_15655, partial [Anaerolineae bacterium]|nr:hypothetical protein [Anaerolineae bacterium]